MNYCYNHHKFYYENDDDGFDPFPNCESDDEKDEAYDDIFSRIDK